MTQASKIISAIIITAVIVTAIIVGGGVYYFQKNTTKINQLTNETTGITTVEAATVPTTATVTTGQAAQKEIQQLLATKFGMRLSYREPIYSNEPVKSPNGTLVATINDYHTNRFIEVKNINSNSIRQYINNDTSGITEEMGDLHFSPDGTKLAYATYIFNLASNNEPVTNGMGYVYLIDLQTGRQSILNLSKKTNTVLRVTAWKDKNPVVVEELLNDKNQPGGYPSLFIPYNFN